MKTALETALLLAGIGHFLLLLASFQVPARLRWKEELAKLTPLNRKLMWVYGAHIVLCIVGFGTLTLLLRDELISGGPAATGLAIFIASFWSLRLAVELFVFRAADWPQAAERLLLTLLFGFLAITYWSAAAWHLF